MKKILSLFLALALVGSLAACNSAPVIIDLDTVKPWETETLYERATYTIDRYRMVKNGKETVRDGDPIATGTVEMTVRPGNTAADESAVMQVETTYSLTYEDSERAGADRGLTDTIESNATFRKTGMAPLTSFRKMTIAPREGVADPGYTAKADYAAGTAEMLWKGNTEPETRSVNIEGSVFDNEQLYFVTRAFKDLAPKQSVSFKLVNLHDLFLNGSQTYSMTVSCAEEKETLYIGEWATAFGLESDGNGHAKVECLKGSISKADTFPGPSQTAYYSNQAFKTGGANETKKVIISIVMREYGANATETFNTVYTLSAYTTTPNA